MHTCASTHTHTQTQAHIHAQTRIHALRCSCSGRISVLAEPTPESRAQGKKGGEWVYTTHDEACADEVVRSVKERCKSGGCMGVGVGVGVGVSVCRAGHLPSPSLLCCVTVRAFYSGRTRH
eukprot:scaffold74331_cov27-Tisochrysis_lutea.AAC.1